MSKRKILRKYRFIAEILQSPINGIITRFIRLILGKLKIFCRSGKHIKKAIQ